MQCLLKNFKGKEIVKYLCALIAFYQYILVLAPRTASSAQLQRVRKRVAG